MHRGRTVVLTVLLTLLSPVHIFAANPSLVQRIADLTNVSDSDFLIDTRPLASCRVSSVQGAICLPIEEFLAPNRRLANWSGIMWLLGSAGLDGNEHVVVVGQQADRRDFIAGLLVLAGQNRISIIERPISELIAESNSTNSGATRSTTRTSVYKAPMRSELIVLRNEVSDLIGTNVTVLDGRSEAEYYGVKIRAARGGHLPGAVHSPLGDWRSHPQENAALYKRPDSLAYAHNVFEGLVFFTALQVAGVQSRLYLSGWAEWAADGALPADSASYPAATTPTPVKVPSASTTNASMLGGDRLISLAIMAGLLVIGFLSGRLLSGRKA